MSPELERAGHLRALGRDDHDFTWECTDKAEALRAAARHEVKVKWPWHRSRRRRA